MKNNGPFVQGLGAERRPHYVNGLPQDSDLLTTERIILSIRQRYNPITNLDSDSLVRALDQFDVGIIRNAALMWDVIERRDDLVGAVATKRKKAIARNGFEVMTKVPKNSPDYAEALKHKAALQYFYQNVRATTAIDANEQGGFKLLIRQMMDCVGKKYAVHEILWKPSPQGLTAELRFVPLWFFENRTGKLRYLPTATSLDGIDLTPGAWMITVGDGLMMACSLAWMLKNMTLQDWSTYIEQYGKPGIIANTTAARGSAAFTTMQTALTDFLDSKAIVTNAAEGIQTIDLNSANQPYENFVARMDQIISALWRGNDLSTLSKGNGYGASVQAGESQILEEDDAEVLSETLEANLDRTIIEYTFGKGVHPLAHVVVQQSPRRGTQQDMIIDQFLVNSGMRLSITDAGKRYGRAIADDGEPILTPATVSSTRAPAHLPDPENPYAPEAAAKPQTGPGAALTMNQP